MSSDWSGALEKYARLPEPQKTIPQEVFLASNESTVTIFDGFEKAKFHFLIMPRDPFPLANKSTLPSTSLRSLSHLLKQPQPQVLQVLRALQASANETKATIQDEMRKTEGWAWPIEVGFHASESMRHVHLHVISSDLISPKLKNKKHYNSFHPKLGFFLHLDDVIDQVATGNITCTQKSANEYEQIFKLPLKSHYTREEYKNLPKLKEHLEAEFNKRAKAAKAKASAGASATSAEAGAHSAGGGESSAKRPSSPPRVDEDGWQTVSKKARSK